MKTCPHCEASLEETAVRCSRCGKWVVTGRDLERSRRKKKKKKGGTRNRLVLLGALLLLAWVIWTPPGAFINPREVLSLEPTLGEILGEMRSDLERLVSVQTRYFDTNGVYSGNPSELGFEAPEEVTISLIVTPTGWSAATTYEGYPHDVGCAVFGGEGRPPRLPVSPTEAGVVECSGRVK